MWIHGRRAFRPDGLYYRDQRRHRLRRPSQRAHRGRRGTLSGIVAAAALAIGVLIWLLVR